MPTVVRIAWILSTQEGFLSAIGRAKKAKGGQGAVGQERAVDKLPAFLAARNLKPFISLDLVESTRPIIFKPLEGGYRGGGYEGVAFGYRAELLTEVCRVHPSKLVPAARLGTGRKHDASWPR